MLVRGIAASVSGSLPVFKHLLYLYQIHFVPNGVGRGGWSAICVRRLEM
jgi:hypothetical protein